MINLIAAVARNGVMGRGNELPWSLPSDLKHFQRMTKGQAVIMGRNTWESLPDAYRPLPKRKNIVVSRTLESIEGAVVVPTLSDAFYTADYKGWIIGGAQLYGEALRTDPPGRMVLTEIDADIEGDVFFPEFNRDDWLEVSRVSIRDDNLPYDIVTYDLHV